MKKAETLLVTSSRLKTTRMLSKSQICHKFSDPETEIRLCFIGLKNTFQDFYRVYPNKYVDADLIKQFKKVSDSFDLFHHFVIFHPLENRLQTEKMDYYASNLVENWIEYIRFFQLLSKMGRAPQLTEINRAFDSLFVSLTDLNSIGATGKFKTDVTLQTIQKIQKTIEVLRKFVQKAFLGNSDSKNFDENDFESKITNVTKNINFLFLKSINHDCITSYEKVTLQTSMTSSVQCIRENVKNAILQPDRIQCLRAAIIEFNMKLQKEFIKKGYQFPVKFNFDQNP